MSIETDFSQIVNETHNIRFRNSSYWVCNVQIVAVKSLKLL